MVELNSHIVQMRFPLNINARMEAKKQMNLLRFLHILGMVRLPLTKKLECLLRIV